VTDSPALIVTPRSKPRARRRLLPGLFRRSRAAWYCGVATPTWDRWAAAGLTPSAVRISGAVLWARAELAAWCRHGCPPRAVWSPIWRSIVTSSDKNPRRCGYDV
jgi:predicted DNA-binding transcriptional regulator AlpA